MTGYTNYPGSTTLLKFFNSRRFGCQDSALAGGHGPTSLARSPPRNSAVRSRMGQIPVEIILYILQHFVESVQPEAHVFVYRRPAFVQAPALQLQLRDVQRTLLNVALTCRNMYGVGTEFLYARPFLPTPKHIRLFQRTLTQVPELALLVKEIAVLDVIEVVEGKQGLARLNPINILTPGTRTSEISPSQSELIPVLGRCTAVETLTINVERSVSLIYDLDKIFTAPPVATVPSSSSLARVPGTSSFSFSNRLRRLVMNGCEFYTSFSMTNQISLPALEVLCLRGLYIRSPFELPHLPRLHTLQIAHVYRSQGVFKKITDPSILPALRTLELFQNHDMGLEFSRDLAALFPDLERVHIVGSHYEYPVFNSWVSPSRFDTIRHLAVGVLFTTSANLMCGWRVPQMLESLALVISLESYLFPTVSREQDIPPDILGCVNAFLEYNQQAIREGPLRKLTIMTKLPGKPEVLRHRQVTSQLEGIWAFCRANNLEFVLDAQGECIIRFHSDFAHHFPGFVE